MPQMTGLEAYECLGVSPSEQSTDSHTLRTYKVSETTTYVAPKSSSDVGMVTQETTVDVGVCHESTEHRIRRRHR